MVLAVALGFALAPTSARAQAAIPDGEGKTVTLKLCGNCHGTAILNTGPKRTRPAWAKIVDQMAALGVEGTDEEFAAVVDYLVRHYGKINVNAADEKEIAAVLDLDAKGAAAVVKYRQDHGEFADLASLKKVPGLSEKRIDERRDRILFR